MMPAVKHFDPVLGVDIHLILTPVGVVVPVPHPFVGFILDPFDYAPYIGSTVLIGGIHRAIAGTGGQAMPVHIPIGGTFVKPPANECEMFMGSTTVQFDGDAASYAFLPVLSCHDVGMIAPPRMNKKKKFKVKSMVLPTSVVMPIPMGPPVLIGGPPTISLMALAMRFVMGQIIKGAKRIANSKVGRRIRKSIKNKVDNVKKKVSSPRKACGRPDEPIDVVTGANVDEFIDLDLRETTGFLWKRYYDSQWSDLAGPLGPGYRHEFQRSLRRVENAFEYLDHEGDAVTLIDPDPGQDRTASDGFVLRRLGRRTFEVRETRGPCMVFTFADGAREAQLGSISYGAQTFQLSYDEAGRLIEIHGEKGFRCRFDLDVEGRIVNLFVRPTLSDADRILASYQYDAAGCLAAWRDPLGNSASYEYDAGRRMARKVDRRGYAYHYRYDAAGRCVETYGQDGLYADRFEYYPESMMTIATRPDGAKSTWLYNEEGQLTTLIDPAGGVTNFKFDEDGRVIEEIDPAGQVTTYLYDGTGAHTGRLGPTGFLMAPMHLEPEEPDPLAYSLPETPAEWMFGIGVNTDRIARPTQNDPVLLAFGVSSINNKVVQFADEEAEQTERERDLLGRVVRESFSDGTEEEFALDPNGNVLSTTDRDGSVTRNEYVSWNLLGRQLDPLGNPTQYQYSIHEEVTRVEDAGGTVSEYLYDHADRLVEIRRHGAVKERYRYNPAGDLVEKVDAAGISILTLEPGPLGAPLLRKLADGETQAFKYDPTGKIVEAAGTAGKITFQHDWTGRVTRDLRDGRGIAHNIASFHGTESIVLDQFRTRFESFPGGLTITDPAGTKYEYVLNGAGLIVRTVPGGARELTQFDRSGRCRLQAIGRQGGTAPLAERSYHYSPGGDLLRVEDSRVGTTRYELDAAHRLVATVGPDGKRSLYRHDSAGNLIEKPGLAGVRLRDGNRLAATATESFTYNDRNHIAVRKGTKGSRVHYEYNSLDMLVRATVDSVGSVDSAANGSETMTWTAGYDPLGRRVFKEWNGHKVEFLWDDDRLAAEIHDDKRLRIYIYPMAGSLIPCAMVEYDSPKADPASGRSYTIFTNHLGAPIRVEDQLGTIVWSARVEPYGDVEIDPASTIEMPLRFPGHYHDAELGLHCNGFRYYDPKLGRYLQSDPLGIAGGLNLYAYPSNPLIDVDLEGLHGKQRSKKKGKRRGGPNGESPRRMRDSRPSVDPKKHAGMTDEAFEATKRIAQKHQVKIRMRSSNPDCLPLIRNGHPRKPMSVKNKSISDIDLAMGPPPAPGTKGMIGHFEPPSEAKAVQRAKEFYGDKWNKDLEKKVKQRRADRLEEFNNGTPKSMKVDNSRGVVVDNRPNSPTKGKEMTGDHDMFDIQKQKPDGSWEQVTPETHPDLHKNVVDDMKADPDVQAQHGDHMTWDYDPKDADAAKIDQSIRDKHSKGGDPLVDFNPDGSTGTSHSEY